MGHLDQEAVSRSSMDQLVKSTSVETWLHRQLTFSLALLVLVPFANSYFGCMYTYVATLSRDNLTWCGARRAVHGLGRPAWYGRALVGTGIFR